MLTVVCKRCTPRKFRRRTFRKPDAWQSVIHTSSPRGARMTQVRRDNPQARHTSRPSTYVHVFPAAIVLIAFSASDKQFRDATFAANQSFALNNQYKLRSCSGSGPLSPWVRPPMGVARHCCFIASGQHACYFIAGLSPRGHGIPTSERRPARNFGVPQHGWGATK